MAVYQSTATDAGPKALETASIAPRTVLWTSSMPLGVPVVPLVKEIASTSSSSAFTGLA